jgi:hypothetical protein
MYKILFVIVIVRIVEVKREAGKQLYKKHIFCRNQEKNQRP